MKYLLTMLCLLAMVSSCNKDDDAPIPPVNTGRTVLVYISGENSLSSFINPNLQQMVSASKNLADNNHLIAFIDRASTTEMPYIAEIVNGEEKKVKIFDNDIIASDPREMRDIIKWVVENYPAKDYGLVLWSHASGWLIEDSVNTVAKMNVNNSTPVKTAPNGPRKAFGIDNGKNSYSDAGKWMNTPSLAKCIWESGIKFKFIFADMCCFQNIENSYELRNVTEYLIGSPAEIPGDGAPYDAIMPYMFSNKDDFYKGIIDEYEKYYSNNEEYGEIYSVPLSATKTSEAATLAKAAENMWSRMPIGNVVTDGIIYYFARYSVAGKGYDNNKIFYDAYDIVKSNTDDATTKEWLDALKKVVVYSSFNDNRKWMTANHVSFKDFTISNDKISCISMFVPLKIYDSGPAQYNEMIKNLSWYWASGLYKYDKQ